MTTETEKSDDKEVSLFTLGAILLRHRWNIAGWMFAGMLVAVIPVLRQSRMYQASASFVPQGNEGTQSGIASLAGQFGVSLPSSGQNQSVDFYLSLIKSREVLGPLVRDTFVVEEMGGQRIPFTQLFGVIGGTSRLEEELGVEALRGMTTAAVVRTSGIIELSVATKWPSVALAILTSLVDGVNQFNLRSRQGRAAAERQFIEKRLALAKDDLRASENQLEEFLRANRQSGSDPSFAFPRDRLQRIVTLRQQVFTTLTQAYEDARLREVRDVPVITLVESPAVRSTPMPRGRALRAALGMFFGGLLCLLGVFVQEYVRYRRTLGDRTVEEFLRTFRDVTAGLRRALLWSTRWVRRS